MKQAQQNYFIKEGYQAQSVATSLETKEGDYWNDARLLLTEKYQYYVYLLCARLIRERNYSSFMDVGCGPAVKVAKLIRPICNDITLVDQPTVEDICARNMTGHRWHGSNLESIADDLGRGFDLIVCSDVLEHLLRPELCVNFIQRHLSSHGLAVFSTIERDLVRGMSCMSSPKLDHVREWNKVEFERFLAYSGFRPVATYLYPQVRLSNWEYRLSRLLANYVRFRRWSGCLVVLCEKNKSDKEN